MLIKKFCLLAVALSALFSAAANAEVTYQHIRNATGLLSYNDVTFLIDPMLAEKGYYEGFPGTFNSEIRNPMIELPYPAEQIVKDVDAVVVTHTHLDHWDDFAVKYLHKSIPVIVQNATDAEIIKKQGFKNVTVLSAQMEFKGVTLNHVEGMHGEEALFSDKIYEAAMMNTMGVVFSKSGEKTVYVLGDTIWTGLVSLAVRTYQPDVVVMNTGYAKVLDYNRSIIMGIEDVKKMVTMLPKAQVVSVHMDAINHCTVDRKNMRAFVKMHQLQQQVWIPLEGEAKSF